MTLQYRALAIRYRPKTLSDIVGHTSIVATITNAILMNRIHHAFLLTGTRGVGKTTLARIIALSLNCIGEDGEVIAPTPSPCLKCSNCTQIIAGNHLDVIEFDAASRTGIDSIREIIDNCIYPPMSSRYKIYIIDEVHMLSKSAFNALLKTIEEPYSHLKFIFATTEIKKVPITILSRCQKFVLHNLSSHEIATHISNVSTKEGYEIDEESANLIAKLANGSIRDSLSLLDQVLAMSESKSIDITNVKQILSIPEDEIIINILDAILHRDLTTLVNLTERLSSTTQDIYYVFSCLLSYILDIMKHISIGSAIDDKLLGIYESNKERIDIQSIMRMMQILSNGIKVYANIEFLTAIQIILFQIVHMSYLPTPKEMLDTISKHTTNLLKNDPTK